MDHSYVGVEHVLLAILEDGGSVPIEVMRCMGLDTAAIKDRIAEHMQTEGSRHRSTARHGWTGPPRRTDRGSSIDRAGVGRFAHPGPFRYVRHSHPQAGYSALFAGYRARAEGSGKVSLSFEKSLQDRSTGVPLTCIFTGSSKNLGYLVGAHGLLRLAS